MFFVIYININTAAFFTDIFRRVEELAIAEGINVILSRNLHHWNYMNSSQKQVYLRHNKRRPTYSNGLSVPRPSEKFVLQTDKFRDPQQLKSGKYMLGEGFIHGRFKNRNRTMRIVFHFEITRLHFIAEVFRSWCNCESSPYKSLHAGNINHSTGECKSIQE